MNHRLLYFVFLCGLVNAANMMLGMEKPQILSIFYAKDNNNNYLQLDQQGFCKPQKNINLDQLLSPRHPDVFLSYDIHTQKYSLKYNAETIANIDTLHKPLIKQLRFLIEHHPLYAHLNNNEYARISFIISPYISYDSDSDDSDSNATNRLMDQVNNTKTTSLFVRTNNNEYEKTDKRHSQSAPHLNLKNKKLNNAELNKKVSFIPSYKTIAKSLAAVALMYVIIKYIHRLPQLFNTILHLHHCQLDRTAQ